MMARPARVAMRLVRSHAARPPAACAWSYHRNASTSCMEPNTPRKSAWPRARVVARDRGSPPRRRRGARRDAHLEGPTRARGGERRVASSRGSRRRAARERATARVSSPRKRDAQDDDAATRGARDRAEPRSEPRAARAPARTTGDATTSTRHARVRAPAVVVAGETSRPSATIRSSRRGRHSCARTNCNDRRRRRTRLGRGFASLPETGVRAPRARPFISSQSLRRHRLSRARTPTLRARRHFRHLVTAATRARAFLHRSRSDARDRPDDNLSRFRRRRRRRRRGHLLALGPDRRVLVHPRAPPISPSFPFSAPRVFVRATLRLRPELLRVSPVEPDAEHVDVAKRASRCRRARRARNPPTRSRRRDASPTTPRRPERHDVAHRVARRGASNAKKARRREGGGVEANEDAALFVTNVARGASSLAFASRVTFPSASAAWPASSSA